MHYVIRNRNVSTWVATDSCVVIAAPESMRWSIGKKIATVMSWCADKRLKVYVAENDAGQITKMDEYK